MSTPSAYPLTWPAGRPRTAAGNRKRASFGTAQMDTRGWRDKKRLPVYVGAERVVRQLELFGARYTLISTSAELRRDGKPRSDKEPEDPGAAVYFSKDGRPYCLACDTFDRLADNLAAIAGHIEATRRQLRYGVATAEQSLRAFEALPPPSAERPWRDVLDLGDAAVVDREAVMIAYRRLARERHPDRGGSHAMMSELNTARTRALADVDPSTEPQAGR